MKLTYRSWDTCSNTGLCRWCGHSSQLALENSASKIGLRVNQDKIKYVLVAPRKERERMLQLFGL
jgi:hypothetical protein